MPTLSTPELTKLSQKLARALSSDDVNQLGRDTGQAQRLRTVTPHRLFLAMVSTLGSGRVESLADLLRAFNYQNGETVAYKAFYNRLAREGFATFMRQMLTRLLDQLRLETLTPAGEQAVAHFVHVQLRAVHGLFAADDLMRLVDVAVDERLDGLADRLFDEQRHAQEVLLERLKLVVKMPVHTHKFLPPKSLGVSRSVR